MHIHVKLLQSKRTYTCKCIGMMQRFQYYFSQEIFTVENCAFLK